MFKLKLYKYDSSQESNGYRGEDLSRYVVQGNEFTEDITQVMDTTEITLTGLPTRESFAPETKFIADVYQFNEINEIKIESATRHLCVSQDVVNKPILSDDNYFDHHISFIEPSVVAEKRLVDNIATTYKLKNVTLEEVPAYPSTNAKLNVKSSKFTPSYDFGWSEIDNTHDRLVYGKYFSFTEPVYITKADGSLYDLSQLQYNDILNFDDNGVYRAKFWIPALAIYAGRPYGKKFQVAGYASLDYKIEEFAPSDLVNPTNVWKGSLISNSDLSYASQSYVSYVGSTPMEETFMPSFRNEWILENIETNASATSSQDSTILYFKKYSDTSAPNLTDRFTQTIEIKEGRQYTITISLHEFEDNIPTSKENQGNIYQTYKKYTGEQPNYFINTIKDRIISGSTGTYIYSTGTNSFTASQTTGVSNFFIYGAATQKIVYASSTPYSALALLQKAIINSSIYEKKDGVYIADVNQSNLPFYIDDNYVDELSATLIIENFYNQKNLWQIMVEVGNYIHAIPEIKFGSDDRFVITFNKLGNTQEYQDKGNKISIYNSRSVEDYISATSSYITNMVQLGGYIEEWVAPKTTNEQLLVYNDTAEIILSKPIIELREIKVRRNSDGAIADMTNFIYEENVYKTLSLNWQVIPNRGIAMYYSLGNNVITGGQYQLPQSEPNIYSDYAFKKIIYCAFNGYKPELPQPTSGYWYDLDVKDYSFYVKYRTKDSVRQNHIRPDLRKYLLNTKHDRYPEHNQFNNQQDVVVDSIKFGNNMFGKLIRTGNNSYEIWEWHSVYENIKHKGELYRINEELYYVAKVTHYIYSSYILSKVSFSKDYNELSNIIGIPSEPRFYEISEQSLIWREFAINDLLLLTDNPNQLKYKTNYMFNYDHLADLVLGEKTVFAKYAITVYKGDKDTGDYDQTVGEKDTYIEVINPLNAYSSENTLTYEWDMEDNYSAGDKIVDTDKTAYNSLKAVGYTDKYGKAALLDFYILEDLKTTPTPTETNAFPESPISTKQGETRPFIGDYEILASNVMSYDTNFNGRGIGLLKDCREAISINFNLQMAVSSDTFVLSPYVYLPKKENLKIVLLSDEVNKLSTGYINNSVIMTPLDKNGNAMSQYFDFSVEKTQVQSTWDTSKQVVSQFSINLNEIFANVNDGHFNGADGFQQIKSIAILCDVPLDAGEDTIVASIPYKTQFVVARNIPTSWNREQALATWYWGSPNKEQLFKNKQ